MAERTRSAASIKTITRNDLISEIVDDFGGKYQKKQVREILGQYEYHVIEHLKSATPQKSVLIRLFFGLQLTSKWVKEQTCTLAGVPYTRENRIYPHARFTRNFVRNTINRLDN
ncbi:MAG: hypothetical protein LUF78_08945 [Clostridiales bacterium]|nr:hypothetical protein [Clostridiales bacterium]